MGNDYVKIQRKHALEMNELIKMYISSMKLSAGLNVQRVFAAWNEVSGAAQYTLRKYFRNGVLCVTMGSSVVRSRLTVRKSELIERINGILEDDELFTKEDPKVPVIKDIILK